MGMGPGRGVDFKYRLDGGGGGGVAEEMTIYQKIARPPADK